MTRVLLVGYDPETVDFSNPALPPGMTIEKIRAGIAATLKQMTDRGWEADVCLIRADETAGQTVERHLASASCDCVVIGAGVRLPPQGLALFEAVVNAVHRAAPAATIAFNTWPEDSADAAARWLPPGYRASQFTLDKDNRFDYDPFGADLAHRFEELPSLADRVVDIDDPLASRLVEDLSQHLFPLLDRAAPQVVSVDVQNIKGDVWPKTAGPSTCYSAFQLVQGERHGPPPCGLRVRPLPRGHPPRRPCVASHRRARGGCFAGGNG